MSLALAIDLGGTKIEAALVDEDGRILPDSRTREATGPASDPTTLERALESVISRCRAHPEWPSVTAAGIGSAGPIDIGAGTIAPLNLAAVHGFPLVDVVRTHTGLPSVTLRLDGTCIALAEVWQGAARDVGDAVVFVVSTGIGGGIFSGGRLLAGSSGNAGHLGQLIVTDIHGDPADATVERLASGPHTVAWARAQGWSGETGEDLAAAYRAGDGIARAAVGRSAGAIGVALASATTLLDLELAVVGGGFSFVADDFTAQIETAARAAAAIPYARELRVVRAGLGGDAPLIGAAALVHRSDLL